MDDTTSARERRLKDWLVLIHTPGLGARGCEKLLTHFSNAADIRAASRGALEQAGLKSAAIDFLKQDPSDEIDGDLRWAAQDGNRILTLEDPAYPELLKSIASPPPVLFVHGRIEALSNPQLAMVGSRNPTRGGRDTAFEFARHLAGAGLTITSGLALGIDAAAHEGALAADGETIAVMGTGPDRIYPAAHRDLAHRIAESGGALVSEFPPGTPPVAANFPRRNRLISGLSLGTLVVEAAIRSGSLITARFAGEQGRETFAIPGSIHNPLARGCHALIRDGAKLIETANDILEELAPQLGRFMQTIATVQNAETVSTAEDIAPEYEALLEAMGYDPVTTDDLMQRIKMSAEQLSSMLLLLELDGHVTPIGGAKYLRTKKTP